MQEQQIASERFQADLEEQRERINQEKGGQVEPPRTVSEQVDDVLDEDRLRDPQQAAERQQPEERA